MKKPVWIDEPDALVLHTRLLAMHAGAGGSRNRGLLQSALARSQQQYACAETCDIIDTTTPYTAGIVRNHPALDGNEPCAPIIGRASLQWK